MCLWSFKYNMNSNFNMIYKYTVQLIFSHIYQIYKYDTNMILIWYKYDINMILIIMTPSYTLFKNIIFKQFHINFPYQRIHKLGTILSITITQKHHPNLHQSILIFIWSSFTAYIYIVFYQDPRIYSNFDLYIIELYGYPTLTASTTISVSLRLWRIGTLEQTSSIIWVRRDCQLAQRPIVWALCSIVLGNHGETILG